MKKLDIKHALADHNMSQIDLCQKIGVAQQNMSAKNRWQWYNEIKRC